MDELRRPSRQHPESLRLAQMSVGYYYNSNSTWGHQWIQIFTK